MEGAISALREEAASRQLSVIVNESTPDSITALQDHVISAVVATPLALLCRSLVDLMVNSVLNGFSETPGQLFLPFNLHVPESV
jgi:LacI family transcriptional regulator